ncbi:MAG: thiamine pyrophosphate-binding protein [Spirochaetaceae bacterium]|nr:thiamine pyrophosphate-binding protein [Spirochaetaceae bacterium]
MRAADALMRAIVAAGTRHVFTLSGNQIMSLFDAAIDLPLELIHVRHEAPAVHAADAIGRLSGRPGVAMVTAGPGFANTLSALYVAQCAESPLVLLSGASPAGNPGAGAFQEMDQAGLAAKVCKASWTCTDPERIAADFVRAWRCAASGRPGPVHVALPVDVLESVVRDADPAVEPNAAPSLPAAAGLAAVCQAIGDAARPLVIAGPPYRRRHAADTIRVLTDAGAAALAMDSPRGLRDPALGAFAEAVAEADLVVLLGKRLDHMLELGASPPFAPACRFMHIDPEPEALRQAAGNADGRMLLQAQGDPPGWAAAIAERLAGRSLDAGWRAAVDAAVAYRPAEWRKIGSESPVHPAQLGYAVHDFLAGSPESVFISDGGEVGQWAQACVTAPHRIINGPAGAIGSALPFALAARTLFPKARIAATLGDGTFGFHPLEIDTALRHDLPFVAVVGNDARWNAEVQIQHRTYGADRAVGCDLRATRYDEVGRALGAHGAAVESATELPAALEAAQASGIAAGVNVSLQPLAAPVITRH